MGQGKGQGKGQAQAKAQAKVQAKGAGSAGSAGRAHAAASAAPGSGGAPKRPHMRWSPEQDAELRALFPHHETAAVAAALGVKPAQANHRAFRLGLRKSAQHLQRLAQDNRARSLDPAHAARRTVFAPGQTPWNKGLKGLLLPASSQATQFCSGQQPHNTRPVGSFRVTSDGILEMKFSDSPGPPKMRWRAYAALVWEAAHGPVPAGHLVVFAPGQHTTDPALVTLDRLQCITRADNARRNSIHKLPPELAALHRLRGQLTRAINDRAKQEQGKP